MNDFPNLNPREFQEIFAVTDEMRLLRSDPSRLNLGDYKNLLASLCGTLRSAREQGLDDAIRFGSRVTNDPEIAEQIQSIVSDLDAFMGFIQFERDTLTACGASEDSADAISEEIFGLREHLFQPSFDADGVIAMLSNGHEEICRASKDVTRYANSEHQFHEDKKRSLLTYGAAATLANSAGTAITAGAGFPFFGMSIAAGGLMITLRGTLNDPLERPPSR